MQNYRNYTPDYNRRPVRNNVRQEMPAPCPCTRPVMPDCDRKDDPLSGMPLAMAYVPWQRFSCPMEADKALCTGTIFEELNKPFLWKGGMGR